MDPEVLKSVPFFADLDEQELTEVAAAVTEMSVPEGKEIVREGDYSPDLFVIEDGEAAVVRDGSEIARLSAGDFFGEAGVVEKAQRNATIRAETRMRLIVLDHWALGRLEKSAPRTVQRIRELMTERS